METDPICYLVFGVSILITLLNIAYILDPRGVIANESFFTEKLIRNKRSY